MTFCLKIKGHVSARLEKLFLSEMCNLQKNGHWSGSAKKDFAFKNVSTLKLSFRHVENAEKIGLKTHINPFPEA